MKRIAVFTGNRSEWGLLEPLVEELDKEFDVSLIISGSHLSKQFGETSKYIPDKYKGYITPILVDNDTPIGTCHSMGLGLIQFPSSLSNLNSDCLIVLGDRFEALAVSIAAYNLGIPIAHIQGDDVTLGSLDDGYRRCIRELASIHLTVEEYGSLGCVFPKLENVDDIPCDYLVVYHANKENDLQGVDNLLNAIDDLDNVFIILPNPDAHGRELSSKLISSITADKLERGWNYGHSISRSSYLALLKKAKCIIGNSSSGIIEAPSLSTVTVNVGVRQNGRMAADSIIDCDGSVEEINAAIVLSWSLPFKFENPYYKPNTIKRMIETLRRQI